MNVLLQKKKFSFQKFSIHSTSRYDQEDELNENANDWEFGYYSYILLFLLLPFICSDQAVIQ